MNSLDDKAKRGLEDFEAQGGSVDDIIATLNQRAEQLLTSDSPKKKRPSKGKWVIVILLLLIALAGIYFLWDNQQTEAIDSDRVFASYFEPFPNVLTDTYRGHEVTPNETISEGVSTAMQQYDNQEFTEAVSTLSRESDLSDEARFYLGMSALASGQTRDAVGIFSYLIDIDQFSMKDASQWYLALAHIQGDDIDSAKAVLQNIIDTEGHYKLNDARDILKTLNK